VDGSAKRRPVLRPRGTAFLIKRCGFTAVGFRGPPDGETALVADAADMRTSYGVVWREGEHPLARGKLELLPRTMRLDGMTGSEPTTREIAYDYLSEIRIGRSPEERIDGRPSLVLAPRSGDTFSIASVAQAGVLAEIAERLTALQLGADSPRHLAVVLPVREESRDAVRELLAAGPPFDPEALGLDRHQVYLTATEAIFIFESRLGADALEPLLRDSELWQSAAAWHDHLSGPPRIAEDVFSWARSDVDLDRSLLPPGLRGEDYVEA
jgi:hypothetical protein